MVSTPPRASNLPPRRYWTHLYTTLLQDNIDLQCSTPWKREGFSKTDSAQYCNSKKHLNQEEAQLLVTPSMHQIQPNGSIKDYLRNTDVNIKHKLKTSQREASRRMKQEETRRNTEAKENHTTVKAYTVLHIYEHCTWNPNLITALPKF